MINFTIQKNILVEERYQSSLKYNYAPTFNRSRRLISRNSQPSLAFHRHRISSDFPTKSPGRTFFSEREYIVPPRCNLNRITSVIASTLLWYSDWFISGLFHWMKSIQMTATRTFLPVMFEYCNNGYLYPSWIIKSTRIQVKCYKLLFHI